MNKENSEKIEKPVKEKSILREICEWIFCIVTAFTVAMLVRYFVLTPTIVCQPSMTPTILDGERVIINRFVRTFNLPLYRGDIVTFEKPEKTVDGKAYYDEIRSPMEFFVHEVLETGKISYIKRVIGLPGDHIEIIDGKVYVDGKERNDANIKGVETPNNGDYCNVIVPDGYVFVMGDNRPNSTDSRYFGVVPMEKIDGRVTIRIWPLSAFGKIDD